MISRMLRPLLVFLLSFGLLGAIASQAKAQTISEIPYTEDFEGVTVPELPGGWDVIGNVVTFDGATTIGGTTLEYPTGILGDDHRIAILPEIEAGIDIATLELSLNAYATSTVGDERIEVGFMSDPADPATFTLVETISLPADGVVTEEVISLAAYSDGVGRRIALKAESPSNWNRFFVGYVSLDVVEAPVFLVETEIVNEPLRDGALPAGWSQEGVDFRTAAGGYALFETADANLETSVLDLTGFQNVQLTFDVAKFGSGDDGPITVLVSDDGGVTWTAQEFQSPVPTSSTYLTSGPTAITATGSDVVIRFARPDSPTQKRVRDVVLTGEKEFPAPAPVFDPAPGTFEQSVAVTITSELPDADIYFTTDGQTPDETSELYVDPVTLTESTTLSAIVITDEGSGPVTTGYYEILDFVTVSTLAELRQGATDGTVYKLDGEAFLSFDAGGSRNQKWIQDATAGIVIDDPNGVITTVYNVGDGITGLTGTLGSFRGLLQFTPVEDPGTASSTGNPIESVDRTLAELTSDDQGRLVRIQNVVFANAGAEFASGRNYNISDKSGSGVFRTAFSGADYIGLNIPVAATFEGLVGQFDATIQVTPRSLDDMTIIDEANVVAADFALTFPPAGLELTVEGDGDAPVNITWEEAVSDFPVSYFFHLDGLAGDFSDPLVTIPSDDEGTTPQLSLNIRALDELLENLEVAVGDTVSLLWTVTAHIGNDYVKFANAPFEITFVRGLVDFIPYDTMFELARVNDSYPDWMGAENANTERGITTANGYLYVLGRKDGMNLFRLDRQTGEVLGTTTLSGASGGAIPISDIGASGDGLLFGGNLAVDGNFRAYLLNNDNAELVIDYQADGTDRLGDKITVVGDWADGGLTIYAPSANVARVFKWTMNGSNGDMFGDPEEITLSESLTGHYHPSVSPLSNGDFYWNAGGTEVRKFQADGELIGTVPATVIPNASNAIRYLGSVGDDEYFVTMAYSNGTLSVVKVPGGDPTAAELFFQTPSLQSVNPHVSGDVSFIGYENGVLDLFMLVTNNALAGYETEIEGLELPDYSGDLEIISIAEAREQGVGAVVQVEGVITRAKGDFIYMQDETAGLSIRQTSGAVHDSLESGYLSPGDTFRVTGELSMFASLLQINTVDLMEWERVEAGDELPAPHVMTLEYLRDNGSNYQAQLVQVSDISVITEQVAFTAATSYDINDGTIEDGEIEFRVPNASDTEVVGMEIPTGVVNFVGVVGQFSFDDPEVGFQLMLIEENDLFIEEIHWANLQWPATGDIKEGDEFIVYAQIYVEGLTDVSDEASEDIKAWVGVNSENLAPTEDGWIWIEADFNEDKGNNHEYMADIGSGLTEGTYYYMSRFQLQEYDYVYGGFQGGFWDGVDNVSGQLNVAEPTDAELADIPREFGIDQNYPNPFNPATNIRYAVPQTSHVTVRVYNVTGQLVATLVNETRDAGYHNVSFDGTQLASGMYIYRMQAGDFVKTRKLMLIK